MARRAIEHPCKNGLRLFLLSRRFRDDGVGEALQVLTNGIFPHTRPRGGNHRCCKQEIAYPPGGTKDSVAVHKSSPRAKEQIVLRVGSSRKSRIDSNHLFNWLIPIKALAAEAQPACNLGVKRLIVEKRLNAVRQRAFVMFHDQAGNAVEQRSDAASIGDNHRRAGGDGLGGGIAEILVLRGQERKYPRRDRLAILLCRQAAGEKWTRRAGVLRPPASSICRACRLHPGPQRRDAREAGLKFRRRRLLRKLAGGVADFSFPKDVQGTGEVSLLRECPVFRESGRALA